MEKHSSNDQPGKTIYRIIKKPRNFFNISKDVVNDERLSLKALGLLCFMLSKPNDWKFWDTELAKHHKDGIDAVKSAIKELKQAGYVRRKPIKVKGKIVSWETLVFEEPIEPEAENPPLENPEVENPHSGKSVATYNYSTKNDGTENDIKEKDKILQQPKNVVEALSPEDFYIFNSIKNNQFFDDYDSDVCDLVNKYFELYEHRTGKVHPSLVNEQMETVLDHIQECYEHHENGYRREVDSMMNDFFNRDDIQTDYNINHFAAWVNGVN